MLIAPGRMLSERHVSHRSIAEFALHPLPLVTFSGADARVGGSWPIMTANRVAEFDREVTSILGKSLPNRPADHPTTSFYGNCDRARLADLAGKRTARRGRSRAPR